eukprot:3389042-Rhodomonas_salina.1
MSGTDVGYAATRREDQQYRRGESTCSTRAGGTSNAGTKSASTDHTLWSCILSGTQHTRSCDALSGTNASVAVPTASGTKHVLPSYVFYSPTHKLHHLQYKPYATIL